MRGILVRQALPQEIPASCNCHGAESRIARDRPCEQAAGRGEVVLAQSRRQK